MTKCMIEEFDCSDRDRDDNCTRDGVCPFLFLGEDEELSFEAEA